MKKLASIMLALTLVLGMSNVAFAAESADEFTFAKEYVTSKGEKPAVYPSEVLKFEVKAVAGNPDNTMIEVADHTVIGNPDDVVVTVPTYTNVGKWNYTVKEVAGNTQGVTYSDVEFGVQVLVTYDDNNQLVQEVVFTTKDDDGKIEEIVNKYDLGTLTIDKNVSGNLASKTQKFDIDVTFTSTKPVLSAISGAADIAVNEWVEKDGVWTVTKTVSLAHGDAVATFNNIPAGVTYEVVEQAKHTAPDESNGSDISKGYEVGYENGTGTIDADGTDAAVVTNTKGTEVDTGIGTDSLPYILLLAVAFVGIVVFFGRRRIAR